MTSAPRPRFARLAACALIACALFAFARPARSQICVADCNSDGEISLGEVQTSFNIFLDSTLLDQCPGADADDGGEVTLGEVQMSFNQFLGTCEAPVEALDGSDAVEGAARAAMSNVESFAVLSFGTLSASGGGGSASLSPHGLGLATAARSALVPETIAGAGGGAVLEPCELLGRRDIECTPGSGGATRTVDFQNCREDAPQGNFRIRNGRVSQTVNAPGFCDDLVIPPNVEVTLVLEEFTDTTVTADEQLVRRITATLTNRFMPSGAGCMGPDGVEAIDGTLRLECAAGLDANCSERIADVTLRPRSLRLDRQSSPGVAGLCTLTMVANGELGLDNPMLGESFDQRFADFEQELRRTPDDSVLVSQRGLLQVDCLGDIRIASVADHPLRFPSIGECPRGGELRVALLGAGTSSLSRMGEGQGEGDSMILDPNVDAAHEGVRGGGAAISVTSGLSEHAFRSANGNVYQVLQNPQGEPNLGIDDYRITTAVGSTDAVARCDSTQGSLFIPQAVVAAAPGTAFPLDRAVRSGIIPLSAPPCFNPNAKRGAGAVCIGPGCSADCTCAADCSDFSIAAGVPLATDGDPPGAELVAVGPLQVPCSGFTGQETYAIGATPFTVEAARCSAAPADGFTLRSGSSVIVAYAAPFARPFGTGAGGFGIDSDASSDCGVADAVITGVATRNELPAPLVRFDVTRSVEVDLNADDRVDRARRSCGDLSLMRCGLPPPTPTPTPVVRPNCKQAGLPDKDFAVLSDSTSGRLDQLGGATCGDGGNHSAERAYGYRAPLAGFYTIDTLSAAAPKTSFDTLLYVRRSDANDTTCDGGELACNDNAGVTQLLSELTVFLQEDEEVVIVVDGSSGQQGDFILNISRSDVAPSPTPTPTKRADLPDLVVSFFMVPSTGAIGEQIEVSATVANKGDSAAGESQLGFSYGSDAEFMEPAVPSGARCRISPLAPGESDDCTLPIPVPASLFAGTYFLGAIADIEEEVAEGEEGNNLATAEDVIELTGGRPTPTRTPGPTPQPCGQRGATCSGTCTGRAFCSALGGAGCRCINLFFPTPTPTRRPCGSSFPRCNGSCPPGRFCSEGVISCSCQAIFLPP